MNPEQATEIIERLKRIEVYVAQLIGRSNKLSTTYERRDSDKGDNAKRPR